MKRFFQRPAVPLLLLVITGHSALSGASSLVKIYREGVPVSLAVVVMHALAFIFSALFIWQFELLEKQLKALHKIAGAYRGYKERRAAKADESDAPYDPWYDPNLGRSVD